MLRAKSFKKALCLLLVLLLAFIPSVNSRAEGDDVLCFGALDESITQNVNTAIVEKGEFYITGAVNASLDANVRTPEIQAGTCDGTQRRYGTKEVGAWIVDYIGKA